MTVEITQPYKDVVRFKFSTGLRIDITDKTEEGGTPRLYINCVGHGEDSGMDNIFIHPEAANSLSLLFNYHPDSKR